MEDVIRQRPCGEPPNSIVRGINQKTNEPLAAFLQHLRGRYSRDGIPFPRWTGKILWSDALSSKLDSQFLPGMAFPWSRYYPKLLPRCPASACFGNHWRCPESLDYEAAEMMNDAYPQMWRGGRTTPGTLWQYLFGRKRHIKPRG